MAPRDTAAQPSAPADQRDEGDDSTRLISDMPLSTDPHLAAPVGIRL